METSKVDDWAFEVGVEASCKALEEGWESLSEEERCFAIVTDLDREVHNGGFDQYFHNSSGDYSTYAVEYLIKLGAMETARIVKDAVEIFPGSGPSQDQGVRWDQMRSIEHLSMAKWEKLDDMFYAISEDRSKKMYELHQKNI